MSEAIAQIEKRNVVVLRKENAPISPQLHPELDSFRLSNEDEITEYQRIIGVLQWTQSFLRMDTCLAASSLARFQCHPREGHVKAAMKILGCLKKYPKRGIVIDCGEPNPMSECEIIKPYFGHQHSEFDEEVDDKFPEPLMEEIRSNIFIDSNHGHDRVTGKSITRLLGFVGGTPITWNEKRQSSVMTSSFGAEFISLKRAVEEAISCRYYCRFFGMRLSKPTIICEYNMSVVLDSTQPISNLNYK